jgi:hypothetical protein
VTPNLVSEYEVEIIPVGGPQALRCLPHPMTPESGNRQWSEEDVTATAGALWLTFNGS